nr:hypothetical protein [uncultured Christensenella sp.]
MRARTGACCRILPVTGSGNNRKKGVCDIAVWSERCGHTGGLPGGAVRERKERIE